MSCVCCYDDVINESISCDTCKSIICSDCLLQFLKNTTPATINKKVNNNMNGVKCLKSGCDGEIELFDISNLFSKEVYNKFLQIWNQLFRYKVEIDTVLDMKKTNSNDISENIYEMKVDEIVNQWSEYLVPKCPTCKQGFNDFDGCFSIECSRCDDNFCGWCLDYSGDKTPVHRHAMHCVKKKDINDNNDYYGTKEQFDFCFARNIMSKINSFLFRNNPIYVDVIIKMKSQFLMHNLKSILVLNLGLCFFLLLISIFVLCLVLS